MNTTLTSVTFHASSSSARVATEWVSDEIMVHARDNNCSIVTISHAMIQNGDMILVTAIAVFQEIVY
jgi:hypothetical protein